MGKLGELDKNKLKREYYGSLGILDSHVRNYLLLSRKLTNSFYQGCGAVVLVPRYAQMNEAIEGSPQLGKYGLSGLVKKEMNPFII